MRPPLAAEEMAYDPARTDSYLAQKFAPASPSGAAARGLVARIKPVVLELADKGWGPYVIWSRPVNQFGNRFSYFNCPDELLVALALAYPLLDDEGKKAARDAADREFRTYPPYHHPWKIVRDNPRGPYSREGLKIDDNYMGPGSWFDGPAKKLAGFKTLYGVWAYADAMDRWEQVKEHWPAVKQLKAELAGWDWQPTWRKGQTPPKPWTPEIAASPRYQHTALRYLLNGTHGFYCHTPPGDQWINPLMQYSYPKLLAALIGYGRIARRMGDDGELAWAKDRFNHVARLAFAYETSPLYWSSPWLTPEVGRLLRDHAGKWLDAVAARPGVFEGTAKDGFANDGPWYDVLDQHHWYLAHAGSNGAVTPCASMSGFLSQAWLLGAPAERLDDWTDVPWCPADYWFIEKCAVAARAYEGAKWTPAW